MSAPIDTTKVGKYNAIQNALCELVSAESSLNMEPDFVPDDDTEHGYTSEIDLNAKHAVEHMHAAFRLMNMAHHDQESLKTQVFRLVVQLREAGIEPKIKTWLDVCPRCNVAELATYEAFCATCAEQLSNQPKEEVDE